MVRQQNTRGKIVSYLRVHPWRTAKDIALHVHRSPGTVSKYLKELDAEACLRNRINCRDKREYALVEEGT